MEYRSNATGRLDGLFNTSKGVSLTYGYNNLNQLAKLTYGAGGNARSFAYDKLGRLTADELKNGSVTSYDKAG